jgi:hypothetical protein
MQRFEDRFEHAARLGHYIAVPESQDAKAPSPQDGVSMQIVGRLVEVLTAVQLDNYRGLEADEIANIDAERMLSSEFEAIQLSVTQATPEKALSLRLIRAQLAGEVDHAPRASRFFGENMMYIQPQSVLPMTPPPFGHLPRGGGGKRGDS